MYSYFSLDGWFIGHFYYVCILKFHHSFSFSDVYWWPFIQLQLQLKSQVTLNEFVADRILNS
jgi:hypothetical protein